MTSFMRGAYLGAGQGSCIGGAILFILNIIHPAPSHHIYFSIMFLGFVIIGGLIWKDGKKVSP